MSSELWTSTPWAPLDGSSPRPPLSPPPRHVPLTTRLALSLHGPLSSLGAVFFAMGAVMLVATVSPLELARGPLAHALGSPVDGTVESIGETRVFINDEMVRSVTATFTVEGTPHSVRSFAVHPEASPGQSVLVRAVPAEPSLAVIQGMTSSTTPLVVVPFLFLFPGIGLGFVLYAMARGRRWVTLLERGIEAEGTLVSDEATGAHINDQPVRRLTFHFQDRAGDTWPAIAKGTDTARLTDETTERILYRQEDPKQAIVVDEIPAWLMLQRNQWSTPPGSVMGRVWLKVGGMAAAVVLGLMLQMAIS